MEVPEELRIAIELAQRTVRAGGRVAVFAREMVRLLERTEQRLMATKGRLPSGDKRVYVVDGKTEMLAEHRTSGKSNPFRCPKALYDAVVQVLAAADRPLAVEEIAVGAAKVMGAPSPEFQVRLPLRLFMSVDPPLLVRNRARYSRSDDRFDNDAISLWNRLRPT
jgi:hypothetical protein